MRAPLLFLFIAFSICTMSHAQKTDRNFVPYSESMIRKDTIPAGTIPFIYLDSTVVSFEISIWARMPNQQNVYMNRVITNGRLSQEVIPVLWQMMPGSKVYYDNIIVSVGTNRTMRMQDRLFFVK